MTSDQFASAECQKEAIPFLCLYGFPLCSCTHNEIYLPSKDDCERIIAESCRVEYNLLLSLGLDFSDILPDCNLLPMANQDSEGSILLNINLIVIQLSVFKQECIIKRIGESPTLLWCLQQRLYQFYQGQKYSQYVKFHSVNYAVRQNDIHSV